MEGRKIFAFFLRFARSCFQFSIFFRKFVVLNVANGKIYLA